MENPEAERIQAEYLNKLRTLLRRAPADVREDAVREVQSHIADEWQALGGDLPALQTVLERLGPPEEYGRDLALQLMLLGGKTHQGNSGGGPIRLGLAAIFWASTSLIGSVVMLGALFVFAFALGMLAVAFERLRGIPVMLIHAVDYQFFGFHAQQVRFPPEAWSPALIALVGLVPALVVFAGLYRFMKLWLRGRLVERGLKLVRSERIPALPKGWERRAFAAMGVIAMLGLSSCLVFTAISGLIPIGQAARISLPEDLFRTPLTALAFFSGLVFFCSPVLGLLWAARSSHNLSTDEQIT
jgi:hypothetical protein